MRIAAAVAATLFCVLAADVLAAPAIAFERQSIVVSGMTPNGTIAWFGISQEPLRYPMRVRHQTSLVNAAADGTVRLEQPAAIVPMSIWIAADLESGAWAVAAPPEFKMKSATLPAAALRRAAPGIEPRLDLDGEDYEVLYVRPRAGAWRASNGGAISLRSLQPVGSSPASPDDFRPNDIIVVIDPLAMIVRTLRVR